MYTHNIIIATTTMGLGACISQGVEKKKNAHQTRAKQRVTC